MQKGPKPAELTLSQEEQKRLEALVHRHTTPQQLAKRGRMILAAAEGKNNSQIARDLGVCVDTVRSWRTRWIGLQQSTRFRKSRRTFFISGSMPFGTQKLLSFLTMGCHLSWYNNGWRMQVLR